MSEMKTKYLSTNVSHGKWTLYLEAMILLGNRMTVSL